MQVSIIAIVLAALIPLLIGFIYYNPKVVGNAWMSASGMTEEQIKGSNMAKIFGFSILFAFMLAFSFQYAVVHQAHLASIIQGAFETDASKADVAAFLQKYGGNFRTFKHGAFHGLLQTIFVILPIFGTNALFERKSFKYIFIHMGYWAICLMLMGGILSAWPA